MTDNVNTKLHLLPLSVFIIFPVTFATTYAIAVKLDHINAFFAYISDTGTLPYEMNIFAQMLNIAGVLIGFTSYVRFKQIELFFETRGSEKNSGKIQKWNKIGLIFGMIAGLGSSVVGNFQESNVLSVHVIGAWMAFGGGSIFLIIQAWFSFKLVPMFGNKALATLRMGIGWACLILFLVSFTTGILSFFHFTGEKMLKWEPSDGGWGLRVTSTTAEWIMAALFDLYFFTLIPEYRRITMNTPKFAFIHPLESTSRRENNGGGMVMQSVNGNDNDL